MDKTTFGPPGELEGIIHRWNIWHRIRRGLSWGVPGLLFGLGTALGFSITVLDQSVLVLKSFIALAIASGMVGMSAFAVAGYLWVMTPQETSRFFDRYFHLFERTSTALELSKPKARSPSLQTLVEKQHEDALQAARNVEPDKHFFWQVTRLQTGLLACLVLALVVIPMVNRPLFARAQARQAVQQAIEQQVQDLEILKEQIKVNENLTPQQRLDLTKELDKAINDLEKSKTLEQAVAALQQAESNLQGFDTASIQQQAKDLRQAGQELLNQAEGMSDAPLNDFASQSASGNLAQAAESLNNLDISNMDGQEKETLADQLEQAASTISQSNPELAQKLSSVAENLRQGNEKAAKEALNQAAQELSITASQVAQASVAQQAAAQVGQGSDRLVEAGQAAQDSVVGQGESVGSGQGFSTEGSGNGSSSSGENSGIGSGSGSGSGTGSEDQGGEVGINPIDQSNSPGDGGERSYEEVFNPQRLGGSGGESVTLPPSTSLDEILGLTGVNPGAPGPSRVPYQTISPNLVDAYRKYSSNGEIPTALRDFIKNYYYILSQP